MSGVWAGSLKQCEGLRYLKVTQTNCCSFAFERVSTVVYLLCMLPCGDDGDVP